METSEPDQESGTGEGRGKPFSLIFFQYQKSIAGLREFFAALNPVVSTLDTGTLERRKEAALAIVRDFTKQANSAEVQSLREAAQLILATIEHRTETPLSVEQPAVQRILLKLFQTSLSMARPDCAFWKESGSTLPSEG